jgi:hypothetical protein
LVGNDISDVPSKEFIARSPFKVVRKLAISRHPVAKFEEFL